MNNNKWSYIDFEVLINSIFDGSRSIQEPITIYDTSHIESNNISFLSHLLSYENITIDNLLDNLFKIYCMFLKEINTLNKNEGIINMVHLLESEWYLTEDQMNLKEPFNKAYFKLKNHLMEKHKEVCTLCHKSIEESEKRKVYPIENNLQDEEPSLRLLRNSQNQCKELLVNMNQHLEETEEKIKLLNDLNLTLFIDLAMKHRPLYFQLNENNISNEDIPYNIHRIYSNFIYIHNLLYKQTIQYYHYLKGMIKTLNEELKNVNIRCSNTQLIASYPIEEREEGEEGEVGDRDEGGYYIDESGNISSSSSSSSEEDEGEDHVTSINSNKISNKLISSFF